MVILVSPIICYFNLLFQFVIQPNFNALPDTENGQGRSRKLSDEDNDNLLINQPVQGTAADGFKFALIGFDKHLADQEAKIVHILHDKIIVEVKDDIEENVVVMVKNCMERAFSEILQGVPLVVRPELRDSWG